MKVLLWAEMDTVEIESWNNIVLVITGNVNSYTSVPENIFIIYETCMVAMPVVR